MNAFQAIGRATARAICAMRRGAVVLLAAVPLANGALAASATAVEFFHAEFGHYFVTVDPDEIALLDAGTKIRGWTRTGYSFSVAGDATGGSLPVCRFFSTAFAPKSSHFYTPYAAECESLKAGSTWMYESVAFYLTLPSAAGTCAADATAIYRLYNNGLGDAPNHRYTAVRAVFDAMRDQGWIAEGDGATGIFACGPPAPRGGSAIVSLNAMKLGTTYDIAIDVPAGYHPNIDPLPVIYALDAQYRLGYLRDVMRQSGARAILVSIHDMGQRQRDFNVPGAYDFLPFLTHDVIPYVEANYRADPRRRVLSGHSTGGNFPIHALYLEAPAKWSFAHYWSTEGAFWQQQDTINSEEGWIYDAVGRSPFPVTLILARGAVGAGNSLVVLALYDRIAGRQYNALRLLGPYYPELDHGGTDPPAFADALKVLLGN